MNTEPASSRPYVWLLGITFLALGLWQEWRDFYWLWHDSIIYNHGFLVAAGAIYLLYRRRDSLLSLPINGSPFAFLLLAGASVLLLLLQAAEIRSLRLALVPFLICFWGWSIWGRAFLKVAAGPVLLLLFAVPLWDDLSPVLQHITVFFNNILLSLTGIEATINEFLIVLDVGAFMVENGCSGVRYLMVALFLAAFYGQLYYQSQRSTVLLIAAAGLLSMLANWVRVFGIIAAGHYTNMETSLVEDHELFGWIIFIIFTLVPVFFIAPRLERPPATPDTAEPKSYSPASPNSRKHTSSAWVIGASFMVLWPALVPLAFQAKTERIARDWHPALIESVDGWRGPLRHASFWQPDFNEPDIDLSGVYVSDALQQVQLQIVGYRNQTQNRELIFFENRLFDPDQWELVSSAQQALNQNAHQYPGRVNEVVIKHRGSGNQVIVWSWYDVGGYLTDSKLEAKIAGALNKLAGDNRGALWALAGRCSEQDSGGCEGQRAALKAFLSIALP